MRDEAFSFGRPGVREMGTNLVSGHLYVLAAGVLRQKQRGATVVPRQDDERRRLLVRWDGKDVDIPAVR